MNKLVSLTVLMIFLAGSLSGQSKAIVDSTVQPLDSFSHKNNIAAPAIVKPAPNLLVDFKDLFQTNGIGTGEGPTLNPRAVSFVQDYISRYGQGLTKLKEWSRPFFNMMDAVFVQSGLPCELKYLAMIESRLMPTSVSWAGAVGPWQFMPATATRMGLKVNRRIDERVNYVKSTQAAARYLTELYNLFGDWLLVIAAYNGGPGNVLKAIKRSGGSRNFWDIQYYLPAESRNHVKKFISTHYIFEGQGGLTTLTRAEADEHYGSKNGRSLSRGLNEEEKKNAKTQVVSGKFYSSVIARNILMDVKEFNRYNPQFDKMMAGSSNTYELMLPIEKMDLFNSAKNKILSESIEFLLNPSTAYAPATPATGAVLAGKE